MIDIEAHAEYDLDPRNKSRGDSVDGHFQDEEKEFSSDDEEAVPMKIRR